VDRALNAEGAVATLEKPRKRSVKDTLISSVSVVRPTLLYISRMLKKVFTCHPERSEGSHVFEKARFFAALRMTIKVKRFMTHYTSEITSTSKRV